jgi:hypothetical protein
MPQDVRSETCKYLAITCLQRYVLMTNAMNTSKVLDDLLCQGEIPRLLNQELKERKPPKQSVETHHPKVPSSSSKEFDAQSPFDVVPLDPAVPSRGEKKTDVQFTVPSRGEKRKDVQFNSPSPSLTLAQGLVPMPNGEVLHPLNEQNMMWDDLWLEQDDGAAFCVFANPAPE